MSACPRCQTPLTPDALPGFDVSMCLGCTGVLVPQRKVIPLLESLAGELVRSIDLDHPIAPIADHEGEASCPACGRAMETFGYLGTRIVHLDRCAPCALLWCDPEELAVMTVLHARTTRRSGDRREQLERWQEEMAERVTKILLARAAANRIASGMMG